jgi:4'-phosphopantetheinyl transferase
VHIQDNVKVEPLITHSPFLEMPPVDLQLTDDEIHIWFAVLDRPESEFRGFMHTLSIDEKLKAGRFHFHEDRNRFIAAHRILRMLLGRYLSVKANELRFIEGENGKPEIAEPFSRDTIHFNLSHSDGVALFAFSRKQEIGVDIEHIRDIPEMEQIVERFFTAAEKAVFGSLPQEKKRDAFFNCWTRKEAFIKAIGKGLSWPLDKIDVTQVLGEGNTGLTSEGDPREVPDWSIQDLRLAPAYAGAFAINSTGFTLRYFKWMTAAAN